MGQPASQLGRPSAEPGEIFAGGGLVTSPIRGAAVVDGLANWLDWVSLAEGAMHAPTLPGVYMASVPGTGVIIYVGMAGERRGQGLRGRLAAYQSGRGVVSGLGAAAMDRALQDIDWLRTRLRDLEAGAAGTTREWARAAILRIPRSVGRQPPIGQPHKNLNGAS